MPTHDTDFLAPTYILCIVCDARIKATDIEQHMRRRHTPVTPDSLLVRCEHCRQPVPLTRIEQHRSRAYLNAQQPHPRPPTTPPHPDPIILTARRGTRHPPRTTPCSACGSTRRTVWRYTRSNHGTVFICARCKPTIFSRSFGSADALGRRLPGNYEGGNHR